MKRNLKVIRERIDEGRAAVTPKNAWVKLLLIAICLVILVVFTRNILKLFSVGDRLGLLQQKITEEERGKWDLERQRAEVGTPEFIENEARDKLGWVLEGETVVVLPPEDYLRSLVPEINEEKGIERPNWEKWWDLFFGE